MKVLVADKFEDAGLEGLKGAGCEVLYEPTLKEEALELRIKESDAHVLVVRSTKVTAPMLAGTRLGLVIRAGAGYNTIDVQCASNHGIYVANCPGKNGFAVAELAFGLILACDRHIPDNVISLRDGKWDKKRFSQAQGLYGRTLGLIGMGQIGQAMIPRAKAFGMNVVAFSRWMTPDVAAALGIGRAQSLEELASLSDVLSVHVSMTPQTKGMLNKAFFERVRPGAIFVNTSRAEVVDQVALLEAVASGKLTAGLDVFDGEPSDAQGIYDGVLCRAEGVYCTHHIGASTEQAQLAVADEVVRIVREYKMSGNVPNVVNMPSGDSATHVMVVRHADRVGVLANILTVLKDEGVNVQEMENVILGPAHAAIAQIAVSKEPSPAAVLALRQNPNVFDVQLLSLAR